MDTDRRLPGGVIFRSYAEDGTLLTEAAIDDPDSDVEARALADAREALSRVSPRTPSCNPITLLAYDGDSGWLLAVMVAP